MLLWAEGEKYLSFSPDSAPCVFMVTVALNFTEINKLKRKISLLFWKYETVSFFFSFFNLCFI